MMLYTPNTTTWWPAMVLGVLAIVGYFVTIPFVSGYAFVILTIGFILLVLGTLMKGM